MIFRMLLLCLLLALTACGGSSTGASSNTYQMGGAVQGRQLNLAGTATLLAGYAESGHVFERATGIAIYGATLYVAEAGSHTIVKVYKTTGKVEPVAGSAGANGATDGIGADARFDGPAGMATDGTNLYVADRENHTIRKVVMATGAVTTLAGSAKASGSADGTGAAARFNSPYGITINGGDLFVTDLGNSTIRKVSTSTGAVTTVAGIAGVQGSADGGNGTATFKVPTGISNDGTFLYVGDAFNFTIRKVAIASGAVSTLAGSAGVNGMADGAGSAASFGNVCGLAVDGNSLFVTDATNATVRRVDLSTGAVVTIAGNGAAPRGSTNGTGSAATFVSPVAIASDGVGLYISDIDSTALRKVAIATAEVATLAGNAGWIGASDGKGVSARFSYPTGITTDGINLYVADKLNNEIRMVEIATGTVTTLAGNAAAAPGSTDGTGAKARFNEPCGITTDGTNLFVTDSGNNTIRKVVIATGAVTTLAGSAVTTRNNGTGSQFSRPYGITTDGANLYVTELTSHAIRKIAIASGVVSTLAGKADAKGYEDASGADARFNNPRGLTTDGMNLYVADYENNAVRKIVLASGAVTTIATGDIDPYLSHPLQLTCDGANVYVLGGTNIIRRIVAGGNLITSVAKTPEEDFQSTEGITTDGRRLYVTNAGIKGNRIFSIF